MKTTYFKITALCLATQAFAGNSIKFGSNVIKTSSDVPKDQIQLLANDLNDLSTRGVPGADPALLRMMGASDSSGKTMSNWLGERVHYIVGEDFKMEASSLKLLKQGYAFENPDLLPKMETPTQTPQSGTPVKTIMTNIGSAFYIAGKSKQILIGAKIEGIGTVPMSSLRVGLLKIGSGLFAEETKLFKGMNVASPARQASRISTLFHEARHSDGNGKSLGFLHAVCPAGHDYEGYGACDRSLNGPYTIGAYVEKALAENCTQCSVEEKEALRLASLNSFDRVLKASPADPKAVQSELALLAMQISVCQMMAGFPSSMSGLSDGKIDCSPEKIAVTNARIVELKAGISIPSVEWDAAPEGKVK